MFRKKPKTDAQKIRSAVLKNVVLPAMEDGQTSAEVTAKQAHDWATPEKSNYPNVTSAIGVLRESGVEAEIISGKPSSTTAKFKLSWGKK